jgi:hypothetical protein
MPTGPKTRPRPIPIVLLTIQFKKMPPVAFFVPTAMSIPISPMPPYPPLDLMPYLSDPFAIWSPHLPDASEPDAPSICGIRDIFIRWDKVRGPSSYIQLKLINHLPPSLQITAPAPHLHIDKDTVRNRGIVRRRRHPAPSPRHTPFLPPSSSRTTHPHPPRLYIPALLIG